jgi:hypothetical protein
MRPAADRAARSTFRGTIGMLVILQGALCAHGPALALEIQQFHWGFDGQAVANRFNLLSVLVANPSSEPFDGPLQLQKSITRRPVDAPLVETVYLAPHSSRWVQFHPYVKLDWEEWTVSWGPAAAGSVSLATPRRGKPACVLLDEGDSLATGGAALRSFPENLLPAHLTALDGLASVFLDHSPRWEEGRQQAFLDWVEHGGHVHLLKDPRGQFPRFTGNLRKLNTTAPRSRLGAGLIQRHDRERREVDLPYVEQVLVPGRDPAEAAAAISAAPEMPPANSDESLLDWAWDGDDILFPALKKLSRPDHNWILIHLLSLAYLALLFPGCYLIGQQRHNDYRAVFGTLLGIVAMFSLVFLIVGRRGYGERTALHAVAIARLTPDGHYDVSQWSNAFAVDGGDYTFSHEGTGRIYSSCQDEEAVRGELVAGTQAHFTADMPPFSSRSFGHRALLDRQAVGGTSPTDTPFAEAEPPADDRARSPVVVTNWKARLVARQDPPPQFAAARFAAPLERILEGLALAKQPGFPPEFRRIHAIHGRHVYSLTENAGQLELKSHDGTVPTFLQLSRQNSIGLYSPPWSETDESPSDPFDALFLPLVARACQISRQRDAYQFALPEDRVRVLVYGPMPDTFFARTEQFAAQRGAVLYCFDVFLPEQR